MSPCDAFAEQLAGWLPGDEAAEPWMAHADVCGECAALLAAEHEADARLRAALMTPVPDGLRAMIHERLAERPEATPASTRWGWGLAAAAALLMAVGGWALRGASTPASPLQATIVEGQGRILSAGADARSVVLASGQRVVTADGRALIRHRDALVWLDAHGELVVGAVQRGEAPALELVRGTLHFAVAPGDPFVIHTAHGRLRTAAAGGSLRVVTPARTSGDDPRQEDAMNARAIALGLGAVGAAAAIYFTVQTGEVDVSNGQGRATLGAGQQGTASAGAAPAAVEARVKALEARVTALQRERDREKARADRLEARVEVLTSDAGKAEQAAGDDAPPRAVAEVRTDIEALIKEQGMQILGLGQDHALLKELAAMGPAGVDLLGDLLANGDQSQRFGAAALMEKLLDPTAIPLLEEAIFGGDNDDNLLVQRMASHALGKIGGEKAVPVLERIVADGSEWGVRTNAAYSLAEMGRQSGIDWLKDSYSTADDDMARMALLGAMAQVGDPSYLPDLHRVLKEETEYSKRYIAVTGIAKAAREESLPVLEGIMNNPDEDKMIISEARKAYDEIKGED